MGFVWLWMARDCCSPPPPAFLLLGSLRFSEGELLKLIQMSIFRLLQSQPIVESPLSLEYEPTNPSACLSHSRCLLLFCMHLKRNIRLEGWFRKESPWFREAQPLMTWAMVSRTNVKSRVEGTPLVTWRGQENPWKVLDWLTWHWQRWTRTLASNMVGGEDQHPSLSLDFDPLNYGIHTPVLFHTETTCDIYTDIIQTNIRTCWPPICDRCFRQYQSLNYTFTITAWVWICLHLSRSDTARFRH